MKVLILGGSGFLGSYLKKFKKKFIFMEIIKSFFNFDISKKINIGFLKKIKPNIIVNLISLSDVDLCQKIKNLLIEQMLLHKKNIVNYCKE